MQYRLLISIEVVEFLERLPSKTRQALRNAIAAIGTDPLNMADAADLDDTKFGSHKKTVQRDQKQCQQHP